MANKHTTEERKKITKSTLLVFLSFIVSYCVLTFISARTMSKELSDDVTGLKPASFKTLVIYYDGSFGLTNPFAPLESGRDNSCNCKSAEGGNLESSYLIPKGKGEYFRQAFQKQIQELNHDSEKGELSVKTISDDKQEITILVEAGDGYKLFSQYETDGKYIYPKFFMEHFRGYDMNFFIWDFLYALFIAFLTFIGVKLYYGQKLFYYSGIR